MLTPDHGRGRSRHRESSRIRENRSRILCRGRRTDRGFGGFGDRRPKPTVVSFRIERTGLEPVTCCLQRTDATSSTTSDAGKITVLKR